ncbi:MAG: cell envelope integrity protein CreD, partial [Saprospiraceae bacterium]|nr:cell envelope integrity protein CreD [Saprospiraceae bacterium]
TILFKTGNEEKHFGPGTITRDIFPSGVSLNFPISEEHKNGFEFEFDLDINGSSDVQFLPFGRETEVRLSSSWKDPSFNGSFLPDEHSISSDGFEAYWKVLELQRNFPQQGTGSFIIPTNNRKMRPGRTNNQFDSFGVRLILPVDEYQKTQRSSKYASFFIFITFLVFFFIEILNRKRLHSIQYLLVGGAIILFYILLLSISEHFSFNMAYLISCISILGLITVYCWYILRNKKLTLLMFGTLALLYGFFYGLLQLQDYALLIGSIGLFLILATVMYITRNVDWYGIGSKNISDD